MLKISKVSGRGPIVLRLEGQVVGPWVDELRHACAEAMGDADGCKQFLVIDLAGVSFLDPEAIALLNGLVTDRVAIANYSVFVGEQLKRRIRS